MKDVVFIFMSATDSIIMSTLMWTIFIQNGMSSEYFECRMYTFYLC